jgi:hypothetical protein
MQCQQVFHSSASCSASVYAFIERQLNILLKSFKFRPGNSPHSEGVCGELFFFFD